MQLFHHGAVIGGSWNSPSKQIVSVLGFDTEAKPIQIVQKSIKDIKAKSHSVEEFATGLQTPDSFEQLRNPKIELHYNNIVPIPHLLTKIFMELSNTDPYTVANAFFNQMYHYDETAADEKSTSDGNDETSLNSISPPLKHNLPEFLQEFIHVIQFCHLCGKAKYPPFYIP
jgi:hypothetical protein